MLPILYRQLRSRKESGLEEGPSPPTTVGLAEKLQQCDWPLILIYYGTETEAMEIAATRCLRRCTAR